MNPTLDAQIIIAHGAGAGSSHPFMQTIADYIFEQSKQRIKVSLFDFPYMVQMAQTGKRRPPDRMPKLIEAYQKEVNDKLPNIPLFVAGKSMGARVALAVYNQTDDLKGFIGLGFPFHPVGKPEKLRLEGMIDFSGNALIIQGERDTFGLKSEVLTYPISNSINFKWITQADHSLKPLKKSGITPETALITTANYIIEFIYANL